MVARLLLVTFCFGMLACEDPAQLLRDRASEGVAIVTGVEQIDATCDDGSTLSVPISEMQLDRLGRLSAERATALTQRFEKFCLAQQAERKRILAQADAIRQETNRYQIPTRSSDVSVLRSTLCLELEILLPKEGDKRERALRANQNRFGCEGKSELSLGKWSLSVSPERRQVRALLKRGKSSIRLRCDDDLITMTFSPGMRIKKKPTALAAYSGEDFSDILKLDATPLSSRTYRIDWAGSNMRQWKKSKKLKLGFPDIKNRLRERSFELEGIEHIVPIFFRFCNPDKRP